MAFRGLLPAFLDILIFYKVAGRKQERTTCKCQKLLFVNMLLSKLSLVMSDGSECHAEISELNNMLLVTIIMHFHLDRCHRGYRV